MYKLQVELAPINGVLEPYEHPYGYILRGFLMNTFKEIAPEVVHELHAYNRIRPYAIQLLKTSGIESHLNVNFIFFQEGYCDLFLKYLTLHKNIFLSQKEYSVIKIYESRVNIKQLYLLSKPIKQFSIRFQTPTYFNTLKGHYPVRLPIPISIFSSLLHLANVLIPDPLLEYHNLLEWIEHCLYLTKGHFTIKFQTIGKPKPIGGFVGEAFFSIIPDEKAFSLEQHTINAQIIDFLCKLGEYTNIGVNRTAGFGVMQYVPGENI